MTNDQLPPEKQSRLDELCINTIRFLSVDAIQKANSGHPGMPMGAASMAYILWSRFLKHNPSNPAWFDRDRFVLSAGHGSMLLYALLHLTGYDLSLDEIKRFRQWGSKTPGHPERGVTPGVETTTGPLGQGFANAVGMAIAEAHLAARFNRPGLELIDHFTYVIAGDGDLMEGVTAEAASLAGHLRLGKLICLYDDNRISLAASTDLTFTEDRAKRFEGYGWHIQRVEDGNDLEELETALGSARSESWRPSLIIVRTHIGYGSPNRQDSFEAHGSPLGESELRLSKENLGWPTEPSFLIPEEALHLFRRAVEKGWEAEAAWEVLLSDYEHEFPEPAEKFRLMMREELPVDWDSMIPHFQTDPKGLATRVASGKVLNSIAPSLQFLIGGSADLNPSTNTTLLGLGDFQSPGLHPIDSQGSVGGEWGYGGRNIHFGVREHAMGGILNGVAAHGGIIPFGATFLSFSDYLRPALRLAALMELHLIHVFTHDSIAIGEDGPTHQPVEQLAALRAIPGLVVIRPCDANETAAAWRVALDMSTRPTALILSRQTLPTIDRNFYSSADNLSRGSYILAEAEGGEPDLILIATGSEVSLALSAREELSARNVRARVVSMPSWELFDEQSPEYRDSVLPPRVTARLAIEAGSTMGWNRYAGDRGDIIGVDCFGASAPGTDLLREYGFTVENVTRRALALIRK
jgi:transketolase